MPNITARTRRNGTISYRVQFRPTPGARPAQETFTTPQAAQQFIDLGNRIGWEQAREVRQASISTTPGIPTLAAYFEQHLEQLAASATPGTIDGYRLEAARTWMPRLGLMPLDMLTKQQVISWVSWQRKQETQRSRKARAKAAAEKRRPPAPVTVSDKTIANAHGLLYSVLATAGQLYTLPNPAEGVKLPSDGEREEMTFLTPAEYDKLLNVVPDFWKPFVAFLAGTGCRWGEATALAASSVDLDASTVTITRAWKKGDKGGAYLGSPKTRRSRRTITLDSTTLGIIRPAVEAARKLGPDTLVFRGKRGARIRAQNFHPRVWRPAVAASGVGKTPRVHDLRHSHASWLIGEGVPLPVIQYRLGHESIKTTVDRYGHIMPGAGDVAAAALERALSGITAPLAGELLPAAGEAEELALDELGDASSQHTQSETLSP